MKFPNMFSPVQIGTVTVPNRFVVPPMGNDLANTDGSLSERSLSYYQARAKGGFGLITIESTVEKDSELGGNFRIASYPTGKGQISEAIRSMIVRAKQAGVNIRLNTEATEEPLRALAPNAVILATGSVPLVLPIPGLADCGYVTAQDLLLGKTAAGRRALVVGGGMVGCEAAEYLAERGHQVAIVEMKDVIAADVTPENRRYMFRNFEEDHVLLQPGAKAPGNAVLATGDALEAALAISVLKTARNGALLPLSLRQRKRTDGRSSIRIRLGARKCICLPPKQRSKAWSEPASTPKAPSSADRIPSPNVGTARNSLSYGARHGQT